MATRHHRLLLWVARFAGAAWSGWPFAQSRMLKISTHLLLPHQAESTIRADSLPSRSPVSAGMPRGLAAGVLQSALWTRGWIIVRGRLFTPPYLMRSVCASPLFGGLFFPLCSHLHVTPSPIVRNPRSSSTRSQSFRAAIPAHAYDPVIHEPTLLLDAASSASHRADIAYRCACSGLDAAISALAVAVSVAVVHAPPRCRAYVHALLFDAAMRTVVLDADLRPPSRPACPRSSPRVLRRRHVRHHRRRRHARHGSPRHWTTLVLVIHALLLTAGYERPSSTPPSPLVGIRAHTGPAALGDGQLGADIREAVLVVLVVGREA
ncbi:hypothetical protein B0H10DRAFT_2239146 [Mycena sp. CBHHK59/15]|nr:hypothetical protein B0H10DRAFT_2239146 [Mycena sp. CBHHK59/15]